MAKARGKHSAGLLVYRRRGGDTEVLLVHPGGPFFRNKDEGAWSIPKGEVEPGEDPLETARRELVEETGLATPDGGYRYLGTVRQRGGKLVEAWAVEAEGEPDVTKATSFELEWPPGSGRRRRFPEVDGAAFFPLAEARRKLNPAQVALVDRLVETLARDAG